MYFLNRLFVSVLAFVLALASLLVSLQAQADIDEESLFLQLSGDEELISIATGRYPKHWQWRV